MKAAVKRAKAKLACAFTAATRGSVACDNGSFSSPKECDRVALKQVQAHEVWLKLKAAGVRVKVKFTCSFTAGESCFNEDDIGSYLL